MIFISFPEGVDTSYPHRELTLFHTLAVDATAAITLAAGGEWFSFTLDVLFGKRDVYPGRSTTSALAIVFSIRIRLIILGIDQPRLDMPLKYQ